MAVKNFESLSEEIQTLVNVYCGTAVMVKGAFAKLRELAAIDNIKFDKIYNKTDAQVRYLIKVIKNADDKDFYTKCYEAKHDLDYCQTMLTSARHNYENKMLLGNKFNCVTSPLLLKQVKDLNVTLLESVKNLVVETANDTNIGSRCKKNQELRLIIIGLFM